MAFQVLVCHWDAAHEFPRNALLSQFVCDDAWDIYIDRYFLSLMSVQLRRELILESNVITLNSPYCVFAPGDLVVGRATASIST